MAVRAVLHSANIIASLLMGPNRRRMRWKRENYATKDQKRGREHSLRSLMGQDFRCSRTNSQESMHLNGGEGQAHVRGGNSPHHKPHTQNEGDPNGGQEGPIQGAVTETEKERDRGKDTDRGEERETTMKVRDISSRLFLCVKQRLRGGVGGQTQNTTRDWPSS